MRKLLGLFVLFLIMQYVPNNAIADEWDDFSSVQRSWDGQKSITNSEFEKAIETLEAPQKQREEKQKKKKIKKISGGGTSLHNALDPSAEIKSETPLNEKPEDLILNLPVEVFLDDNVKLEKGYYKVIAKKEKDKQLYLYFYQSQFFKGKIKATETNDDFGEESLDFLKVVSYDENFAKIIFGSLKYNAYCYVRYE